MRSHEARFSGSPNLFRASYHAAVRLMQRFPTLTKDKKEAITILERLADRGLFLSRADANKLCGDVYIFDSKPDRVVFSPELEAMMPVAREGTTNTYTILTVFAVVIDPKWRELVDALKYEPVEDSR